MTNEIAELDRRMADTEAEIARLEQQGDGQLSPFLLTFRYRELADLEAMRDQLEHPS